MSDEFREPGREALESGPRPDNDSMNYTPIAETPRDDEMEIYGVTLLCLQPNAVKIAVNQDETCRSVARRQESSIRASLRDSSHLNHIA